MFSSTSPFSSLTCGGIHSEKRKGRKSQFLFTAQLLRKTNLAEIFSEARSGTIAHKNKKRIMAVTHFKTTLPATKRFSISLCFIYERGHLIKIDTALYSNEKRHSIE
jgi:hypothetical protein